MKTRAAIDFVFRSGIVAIIRASDASDFLAVARALYEGGVPAVEVTMTTAGALQAIEQGTGELPSDVCIGVGSVLDAESARAAILAGARFVVCPTFKNETVTLCHRYGVPVFPGAYTPTEVLTAWEAGVDAVKVFPASVGGPDYIKALKAPLPQIRLLPTGGVDLGNAGAFVRAGADALGVGSALVSQSLLDDGDFAAITDRARRFCEEVAKARASLTGS